eukprot:TRINITY_DN66718_c1_g2_i1.p1 TRINITY_DN66718_c1_g2~~TRINITY_DN66718_c1_g2_i1.p1  ORF type:complete len:353 (-),score=19.89 TRINITY_DN66718_c1_g2_i1:120-1106(-)
MSVSSSFLVLLCVLGTTAQSCSTPSGCQALKDLFLLVKDLLPLSQHDSHQYISDEKQLFLFLQEHNFDVSVTETYVRKYVQWRSDVSADADTTPTDDEILSIMNVETTGRDFDGNLAFYLPLSLSDLLSMVNKDRNQVMRTYVYQTERMRKEIQVTGAKGINVIFDIRHVGADMITVPSAIGLAKDWAAKGASNYRPAERLVVVTPDGWRTWFEWVVPLLPEGTKKNLIVVDDRDSETELAKIMPKAAIPHNLLKRRSALQDHATLTGQATTVNIPSKTPTVDWLASFVGVCVGALVGVGILFVLKRKLVTAHGQFQECGALAGTECE